jgi:glycosyltransferase involved in cell wall biosynthesis
MINVGNVTVIIATLDRPDALGRCLDALLSSDVLPAEVIIVDQSQDDATRSVVEQRRASMVPIIYIRRQQRNASASRNAAITRASCSVVAVTDDDCMPDRGWIAAIERTFASQTAPDAMTGRVLPLGPDEPGLYAVSVRESIKRTEFKGKVEPWVVGVGNNVAVKRAWFNCIGGYDERLGPGSHGKYADDTDLFYRLLRAGALVRYEPDALIYHERKSQGGRMATRWGYGFGIGAFCGIWLCRGDLFALHIIVHWLLLQCRLLVGAIGRRQWLQAYQRSLSLRGAVRGLVYGLRAPG